MYVIYIILKLKFLLQNQRQWIMKLQSRTEIDPFHHVIKIPSAYDLISIFFVLVFNLKTFNNEFTLFCLINLKIA